ncbi:MAG: CHAT domain-containing protein [Planctomycetota bacterium]|nr:CHAT domain-containing protein [Planctomycetota bacterium]
MRRRTIHAWCLLLLLLALGMTAARADDPGEAANQVLDALDRDDAQAVARIARRDPPDPWIVAEELCLADEVDAAHIFAKAAAERLDAKPLPRYVKQRRTRWSNRKLLDTFDAVEEALNAEDAKRVLALTKSLGRSMTTVTHVELHAMRAEGLAKSERPGDAAEGYAKAARGAEKLGWRRQAAALHLEAARQGLVHGDAAFAVEHAESAVADYEALSRAHDAGVSLGVLADALLRDGDGPGALDAHRDALDVWDGLGNAIAVVRSTTNLGVTFETLGEYPGALREFERALVLLEKLDSPTDTADALNGLGRVHELVGNYARARGYLERCLDIETKRGTDSGKASALVNLGNLYSRMGDEKRCLALQQEALELMRKIGDRDGIATTTGNIGASYEDLGEIEKALDHYERALELHRKTGRREGEAKTLENIGLLLSEHGDTKRGRKDLEGAVAIARELGSKEVLANTLESLAKGHYAARRYKDTLRVAEEARSELHALLAGLGENETTAVRSEYSDVFALGAGAAARLKAYASAISFVEDGRAMSLAAVLAGPSRRETPPALRDAQASALAVVAKARKQLEAARERDDKGAEKEQRALEEALDALRQVRDRIRRARGEGSRSAPPAARLETIQAALRAGQTFVFYLQDADEVLALVIDRASARGLSLGKRDALDEAIQALHGPGGPGTRGPLRREEASTQAKAEDRIEPLRTLLVAPLGLGADVKELVVSPAGTVGYVPFGALIDVPVTLVPSATTWLLLHASKRARGQGVLAIGDPDYAGTPGRTLPVTMRGRPLSRLPATSAETKAVGDVRLLRADANEAGLRKALARRDRWRSVHFACHGLLDPQHPRLSALALSRLREEDDGLLSALEVLGMPIHADLAVLSACETGRGKVVHGEGISGLTRAFLYAGVPSVVCSLWKVDDEATRALMVRFYELWIGDKGVAAALREAQDHLRKQPRWREPYYWAAWVVWGLGSDLPPAPVRKR